MPRFIAAHSVVFNEDQLKEMAAKPLPEGVSWLRTYCSYDDGKCFCEWEAPSKEVVEQVLQQAQAPYDAVYGVRLFDVPTASLEP
ncbi:MAG: DUF4242 domain-containing protein [Candidatus Bipolaricaulota bacterium]|nr:MAG: DUF4242 domain-containing protein [Candidatus Bipolaricaulota bacterium]